jgi:23S rRNA (uracil1939-C5)-methyltransferase
MWQRDRESDLLGYYERGSHNVCDVSSCGVLTQPLQKSLDKVRTAVKEKKLAPNVREILAVEGDEGVGIVPPFNKDESLEIRKTIGKFTYTFSAGGFFQINQLLLPALIDEAVTPLEGRNALDLYCGVGLFSLPLAAKFEKVLGIESNHEAIGYARQNAEFAGYGNAEFESEMVGRWFERNTHVDRRIDAVLLDPPRVGAEKATMRGIVALKPKKICYVSCDPATLARDLKPLLDNGYNIDSMSAFDMFPQTHHIETVTHLSIGRVGKNNGESSSH